MSEFLKKINSKINKLVDNFVWTNTYGFARSFIGLSLLLTLLSNDIFRLMKPFGEINDVHTISTISKISIFYILDTNLLLAKWISIIVLILVIIGWKPRLTGILHWWITFSFSISSFILEGGDQVAEIICLLLIPITLFDHRKFHWQNNVNVKYKESFIRDTFILFTQSVYFMISLQICYIYFNASVGKFISEEWLNGTSIYYWFDNSVFGLSEFWRKLIYPLLENPYLITSVTWGVLVFELLLAASILIKSPTLRKVLLISGIIFHLSIGVFYGLWSFFLVMTGALILYLGPKKGFIKYNS